MNTSTLYKVALITKESIYQYIDLYGNYADDIDKFAADHFSDDLQIRCFKSAIKSWLGCRSAQICIPSTSSVMDTISKIMVRY